MRTINLLTRAAKNKNPGNPYALPKKEKVVEQLENDEILGKATEFTAEFRKTDASQINLYPVAGGVGVTTLVQFSDGMISEPYGIEPAAAGSLPAHQKPHRLQ